MQKIAELLRDAAGDVGDVSFRNDYSGRGMYGRRCVGIVGSQSECLKVIAAVIKNMSCSISALAINAGRENNDEAMGKLADIEYEFETAVDTLLDYSMDSMGYDVILYWPSIEPLEEEETIG